MKTCRSPAYCDFMGVLFALGLGLVLNVSILNFWIIMPSPSPFLRNASFRQGRRVSERWLEESIVRGDLDSRPPTLYQAYVCDGGPVFDRARCRSVSEFFEGPWGKDPTLADTRHTLVRLMAIAAKAHYFIFRLDLIQEEPSVFWVPDLMRANKDRFGLYCPFLKSKKALVVAETDLALVSSGRLSLGKFPVVLTDDHSNWLDENHWANLAKEGDALRLIQESLSMNELRGAREYRDEKTFPFGAIFDVPPDLKGHMKLAGLRWAEGIKKMYLPKGFDEIPVRAYYEHLMDQWRSAQALSQAFSDEDEY